MTAFDNTQAYGEGWGVFENAGDASFLRTYGPIALDRLAEGNTIGPVTFGEDADEAWRFVVERAIAGSAYHRAAILHLRAHAPLEIAFIAEKVPEVAQIH